MPKTASQNALIKERRKAQIMETALKLFANYGIDNVTVDNISQAMKISHGLFYHYFEDKEDLVNALINKAKENFKAALDAVKEQEDATPTKLIRDITSACLVNINASEVDAYYLYLVLSLNFVSDTNALDFTSNLKKYLLKLITDGIKSNVFVEANEEDLATIYIAALQGIAYHKIKFKKNYKVPEVDSIIALLVR